MSWKLKRLFDIACAVLSVVVLAPAMLLISAIVLVTSPGPVLYWSDRVGKDNKIFKMPKFRTMRVDAPIMATHLLSNPEKFITGVGRFLRQSSLDELPQLISILRGEMSFVGPRPALFNQDDLMALRTERGVHKIVPGITGWAQINGRDELTIPDKVALDHEYLLKRGFWFDLKIIVLTFLRVVRREGVSH